MLYIFVHILEIQQSIEMKRCGCKKIDKFLMHGPVSMETILTFEPMFLINIYFLYVGLHRLVVTEVLISFGVNRSLDDSKF